MNEKCEENEKWNSIGSLMTGGGTIILGVAAIIGACAAQNAVTNIKNSNVNSNVLNINLPLACQQFQQLKAADGNEDALNNAIRTLPMAPTKGESGLFITQKYRDDLVRDLSQSPPDKKDAVVQKYYEKSLSELGLKTEN